MKTYLKEIGCEDMYWIQLSQDRVQWRTPVNPSGPIKSEVFHNQLNDCQHLKKDSDHWSWLHYVGYHPGCIDAMCCGGDSFNALDMPDRLLVQFALWGVPVSLNCISEGGSNFRNEPLIF
jgi:hypothetical protein